MRFTGSASDILIGLGAGLASALLFYSAARGSPALSAVLLLLTPLPVLLAGIALGLRAAIAGALSIAIVIAVTSGFWPAMGTTVMLGFPVVLIVYLAFLSRARGDDPSDREWYTAGRLLVAVAFYGGALPLLILPLSGGTYDDLRGPMTELLRRFSKEAAADFGLRPMTEPQILAAASILVTSLPAFLAGYWTAIFTLNLYLAGRIARASGRLARDWPDLPGMKLPRDTPVVFAIAVLACFATGIFSVAGVALTGSLVFAFFLAGLTLAHSLARRRAPALLIVLYLALVLAGPYTAAVLVLGGLADTLVDLKGRFGGPPATA